MTRKKKDLYPHLKNVNYLRKVHVFVQDQCVAEIDMVGLILALRNVKSQTGISFHISDAKKHDGGFKP